MRHLTPRELQQRLSDTATPPTLLDVREPWEFNLCHIAGSELIPMGQISQALERYQQTQEIVVICHHGIRSRHVAYYLEHAGFNNIINLEGGVERWAREIDPTMTRY
ncbi:MAG: sulfurtransferase [Gammaproteobacteria bacterium]|nr:sulfurtransferase [Gammaproteobacteria bacterium]